MIKMKSILYSMLIISLLLIVSSYPAVLSAQDSVEHEFIDIYGGRKAIYVRAGIMNSADLYNWFIENVYSDLEGIDSISLSFIHVFDWKTVYSYFLDDVWYNDTGIRYIPSSSSFLRIGSELDLDSDKIRSLISSLNDYFTSYYMLNNSYEYGYLFSAPYEHKVGFKKIKNIFITKQVAVLEWIKFSNIGAKEYYNITIHIDPKKDVGDLIVSYTEFRKGGISSYLKLFNWRRITDINPIYINIWSRFTYISKYPEIYNISVLDDDSLYINLFTTVFGNGSVNPFDINIDFDLPLLYVERVFNNTNPYFGDVVEVTLKVMNLGDSEVNDVFINESVWWDGSRIIFIGGDTSQSIDLLLAGSSKLLRYRVKVNTTELLDIYIPPASLRFPLEEGIDLSYLSGSNYLHINRDAPFVTVSIEPVSKEVGVGDQYKYNVIVSNLGRSSVSNVEVSDFLIREIAPGEKKWIEVSTSVESVYDLLKDINSVAFYDFDGSSYVVVSPSFPILFQPNEIVLPQTYIFVDYLPVNSTMLKSVITVNNIGIVDIESLVVEGIVREGFVYKGGNFSYIDEYKIGVDDVLGREQSIKFIAYFEVSSRDVSMYPIFVTRVGADEFSIVRYGSVDIFYNSSIEIGYTQFMQPLLVGLSYEYSIYISNLGSANLYNVSISIPEDLELIFTNKSSLKYDKILSRTDESFVFSIVSRKKGTFRLPDLEINFILGGKLREFSVNGSDIEVLNGLYVVISLDKSSLVEDEFTTLSIVITSDAPDLVSDISISIYLPDGLLFEDGKSELNYVLDGIGGGKEFEFVIKAITPGEYNISDIDVKYRFSGVEIDYFEQYRGKFYLYLSVKENVLLRYYIYMGVALLISLSIAIYIRIRFMS